MVDVVADRVVVELFAKLDQYDRGVAASETASRRAFNGIQTGANRMEGSLKSSFMSGASGAAMMSKAVSTLTGVLGAAALIGYARQLIATGDVLKDTSDQLGITTQELQGLDSAARDTGASPERLRMALSALTDQLGDAEKGEGQLAKMMRAMNVPLGTTMQVMYDLADRTKNAATQNERMSIATTAFGRAGKSLVPLLAQGSDGIKRLFDEAQRKGQIWDPETVAKLDAANDAIERLKVKFAGKVANPFTEILNGPVDQIAENFDKLAEAGIALGVVFAGRGLGHVFAQFNESVAAGKAILIDATNASRDRAQVAFAEARAVEMTAAAEREAAAARVAALRQGVATAGVQRRSATGAFETQVTEYGRAAQSEAIAAATAREVAMTQQLAVAERELALADTTVSAAAGRATLAQETLNVAQRATTISARAATVAVNGLKGVLAFFGGPIGFAITALTIAMMALANTTDRVTDATNRTKEGEDGFWKVVDRTTLKIKEQNAALVENERRWNAKTVRDNAGVLSGGVNDLLLGGARDYPGTRHTWSGSMASDQLAIARQGDALIARFKAGGDYSAEAFTRLENSVLTLQERWPGFGQRTLEQVDNLKKLALASDQAAARMAVLTGKATPEQKRILQGDMVPTSPATGRPNVPLSDAEKKEAEARALARKEALTKTVTDEKDAATSLVKAQGEAAVIAANGTAAQSAAIIKQINDSAKAETNAIEAKRLEEIAALEKLQKGWADYGKAVDNINAAAKSRTKAIEVKRDSDLSEAGGGPLVRQAIAQGKEVVARYEAESEAIGLTAAKTERLLFVLQALYEAKSKDITLTDAQRMAIEAEGDAIEAAIEKHEKLAAVNLRAVNEADALRDAIAGIASGDPFGNVIKQLEQTIIKLEVIDPIIENLFGKRGTTLSGGGGMLSGMFGGYNTAGDALMSLIPSFDSGTNSAPGGLSVVHQNELLNLPKGAQVIPAARSLDMLRSNKTSSVSVQVAGSSVVMNGNADGATVGQVKDILDARDKALAANFHKLVYAANRDHF